MGRWDDAGVVRVMLDGDGGVRWWMCACLVVRVCFVVLSQVFDPFHATQVWNGRHLLQRMRHRQAQVTRSLFFPTKHERSSIASAIQSQAPVFSVMFRPDIQDANDAKRTARTLREGLC
eukprot:2711745-Rhodomonas_salina.3